MGIQTLMTTMVAVVLIGVVYCTSYGTTSTQEPTSASDGSEKEQTADVHIVQESTQAASVHIERTSWSAIEVTSNLADEKFEYVPGDLQCHSSQCHSKDEEKCRTYNAEQTLTLNGCHSCGESLTFDTNMKNVMSFRSCQQSRCKDNMVTLKSGSMYTYVRCCNTGLCNNATMVGPEEPTYNYLPDIQGVENMEHIATIEKGGH